MKSIGRKIVKAKCNGQRFNIDTKEMEDFYEETYGILTPQSASKFFAKMYNDNSILITNIEFEEHYYKMSIDAFIENSEMLY